MDIRNKMYIVQCRYVGTEKKHALDPAPHWFGDHGFRSNKIDKIKNFKSPIYKDDLRLNFILVLDEKMPR